MHSIAALTVVRKRDVTRFRCGEGYRASSAWLAAANSASVSAAVAVCGRGLLDRLMFESSAEL